MPKPGERKAVPGAVAVMWPWGFATMCPRRTLVSGQGFPGKKKSDETDDKR